MGRNKLSHFVTRVPLQVMWGLKGTLASCKDQTGPPALDLRVVNNLRFAFA